MDRPLKPREGLKQDLLFSANVTFGDPIEQAAILFLDDQPKGFLFLQYFPEEDPCSYRQAVIDLRRPKYEIQRVVKDLIDAALSERRKHGLKQIRAMKRLRLDTCLDYLRVYDYWKAGKSISEIASNVFQGQSGDIEGKAKRYLRNGKVLVNDPPLTRLFKMQLAARKEGRGLESITGIPENPLSTWGRAGWLRPAQFHAESPVAFCTNISAEAKKGKRS